MPSLEPQWTSNTVALHAHRLTVSEGYREGIRAHYPLRAEVYPVSLGGKTQPALVLKDEYRVKRSDDETQVAGESCSNNE